MRTSASDNWPGQGVVGRNRQRLVFRRRTRLHGNSFNTVLVGFDDRSDIHYEQGEQGSMDSEKMREERDDHTCVYCENHTHTHILR